MRRQITQRELRNESGKVMRALDRGQSFLVTRNGVPVGELRPLDRPHFVATELLIAAFQGSPRVDLKRFRKDVDTFVDQGPTPRA